MEKHIFKKLAWLYMACTMVMPVVVLTGCSDDDDDELTAKVSDTGDNSDNTDDDSSSDTDDSSTTPGTAIDLGLSVKWSNINIGAELPSDCGNYYSWSKTTDDGEYYAKTTPLYGDASYEDISGNEYYDAATVNWGSPWRMPTKNECQELIDDCTWTWTTQEDTDGNAIGGYEVEGTNGNTIFLAANSGYGRYFYKEGEGGAFWTSTASETDSTQAYRMYINPDSIRTRFVNYADIECLADQSSRLYGWPVRPVQK